MRQAILLFCLTSVLFACGTESVPTLPDQPLLTAAASGSVIVVPPSGDETGQTDPGAIEAALNSAGPGDVVLLSDGDPSTVDDYYASEGIVVYPGFDGTLAGEDRDHTIVHAVPQPDGSPFESTFPSAYFLPGAQVIWPTLFHFEYPDAVTVRDLATIQEDAVPASPGLFQHIAVWGGSPDVVVQDLRLSDPGRAENAVGVHVMGGSNVWAQDGTGSVAILDNHLEDLAYGVMPMFYGPGDDVGVIENRFDNGEWDIFARNNAPGSFHIADNLHHSTLYAGVWIWHVTGVNITGNSYLDGRGRNVVVRDSEGIDISNNLFRGSYATAWWHANVYLGSGGFRLGVKDSRVTHNTFENIGYAASSHLVAAIMARPLVTGMEIHHNSFVHSGLPGWTVDSPTGPGPLLLDESTGQNQVHEMQFAPGPGKTLCEMIWDRTDDPVTAAYDGDNAIHGWQPCENLAALGIEPMGPPDDDPPGFLMHH